MFLDHERANFAITTAKMTTKRWYCFSTTSNKGKQILLNSLNKKNTLIYVWRMTYS